jgi:predicted nucleotidyltransferase
MIDSSKNKSSRIWLSGIIPSQLRIDVLNVFFSDTERKFYYREIVDKIGVHQRGSIARELKRLEKFGYIKKIIDGKRIFYRINVENPIYSELRSIWMKTVGIFNQLQNCLEPLKDKIDFAFVYGSFATGSEGAESDVDLMIIGRVKGREVSRQISEMSANLGREINYSVFSLEEVKERLDQGDHFWTRISSEKKVFLIGDQDEFERLGE